MASRVEGRGYRRELADVREAGWAVVPNGATEFREDEVADAGRADCLKLAGGGWRLGILLIGWFP